jgi:hypothetical protein
LDIADVAKEAADWDRGGGAGLKRGKSRAEDAVVCGNLAPLWGLLGIVGCTQDLRPGLDAFAPPGLVGDCAMYPGLTSWARRFRPSGACWVL